MFAPAPVLVCTFEYPHDRSDPVVALNVGGQRPWVACAIDALRGGTARRQAHVHPRRAARRFGPRELDDLYSAAITTVAELVERLAEEIEVSEVTGVGRGS